MRMPPEIRDALEATGLPWTVESGKKHHKVRLCGRLAVVLSHGSKRPKAKTVPNGITAIRRLAAELKEERS